MSFKGVTTIWGELKDKSEMLLGIPSSFILKKDKDAPADLLKVSFSADSCWEEIFRIKAYFEGKLIFSGIVDEQNTKLSSSGITVEIVARSLAALLLDNEAMPQTIQNPSLRVISERFVKPYGLTVGNCDNKAEKGELVVKKGDSCWTALEDFCSGFLGVIPHVTSSGEICFTAEKESYELDGIVEYNISYLNCKRISRVIVQNRSGAYGVIYNNKNAENTIRQRYLSSQSAALPDELIKASEKDCYEMSVKCDGFVDVPLWASVNLVLPTGDSYQDCRIKSMCNRIDKSSSATEFVLEYS